MHGRNHLDGYPLRKIESMEQGAQASRAGWTLPKRQHDKQGAVRSGLENIKTILCGIAENLAYLDRDYQKNDICQPDRPDRARLFGTDLPNPLQNSG